MENPEKQIEVAHVETIEKKPSSSDIARMQIKLQDIFPA